MKERVGGSTQGSELVPAIHMYKSHSRVEHCHEMIKPNEPLTYKLELKQPKYKISRNVFYFLVNITLL